MNTDTYIDRAERAFWTFANANKDFAVCDANATLLGEKVKSMNLDFADPSHLEIAWWSIAPKTTPTRKPAQAPAVAPQPEPLEAAIEKEALRILEAGEIEDALKNLSAKQFEQKSYNLAFARALELREERRVKSVLAKGDLVAAEHRANQQGTSVASEISKSEKRMVAAQSPTSYSPSSARRSGIESTHNMHASSSMHKRTPAEVMAQEKKDQAFIDAANAKTARLLRVKANKGK